MKTVVLILALGLGAGCSRLSSSKSESDTAAAAAPAPAVPVQAASIEARDMDRPVEAVGTLDPNEEVTVASQVEGVVDRMLVDLGDAVRQGQPLATLDTRELELALRQQRASLDQELARVGLTDENAAIDENSTSQVRQARASYEEARIALDRAQKLFQEQLIARQQLDQAQARFDLAEAAQRNATEVVRNIRATIAARRASVDLALKKLADAKISAPLGGYIKTKMTSEGQFLKNGSPVAVIVQNNPLRLRVEAPEAVIQDVRPGRLVRFSVDAFPNRTFEGRITRLAPSLDEQSRTLRLEATVNNDAGLLKPGLFARVTIQTGRREKALVAPAEALFSVAGLEKMFVIEDGKVTERIVRSGARVDDRVEILEGVKEGERVAVSNLGSLQQGREVSVQ
jgi:RND family efflux transporter MFP subunit